MDLMKSLKQRRDQRQQKAMYEIAWECGRSKDRMYKKISRGPVNDVRVK